MFLDKLTIYNNDKIVREVIFKKGVNLVIDERTNEEKASGNDIGKTTFLRAVDFCLGSKGEDIYIEEEFGSLNADVKNFLTEEKVIFELKMKKEAETHVTKRNFDDVMEVDGTKFDTIEEYQAKIKEILYNSNQPKPTLRQLVNKFIRVEEYQMNNALKCLFQATKHSIYEIMYLFLFGFNEQHLLLEKYDILKHKDKVSAKLNALKQDTSKRALKQAISVIDKDIKAEEKKVAKFPLNETYDKELGELKKVRKKISPISVDVSNLEMRLSLNKASIDNLKKSVSTVSINEIEQIYNEAKIFLPKIQKTVEESVEFYNKMIQKKIEFIGLEMKRVEGALKIRRKGLKKLLNTEKQILNSLSNTGSLHDLEKINKEINALHNLKGQKEALLNNIEELTIELNTYDEQLQNIEGRISIHYGDLQNKIDKFNSFFTEYSRKLYDVDWYLVYDEEKIVSLKKELGFSIENLKGKVGSGKKKGQIAAFDLAYIAFLQDMKVHGPRFVMHDQCELIDLKQIKVLFDIADSLEGQFIVPILRDKVDKLGEAYIRERQILSLSTEEKFFRI